eukprot:CAMPEP_0116141452 /NCGR_PEP_ID=MMETSP0329-20121206/14390_1 /TAXON_ID=697910 /ORGANISM="Pseudo-nitzschia arenysensis, Strain B593" /LENGTH=1340 /DNA_ID=CAMNT_0003636637 /DNA_START=322 /DNA_END=4340 /DNA_ORIENTATION=-
MSQSKKKSALPPLEEGDNEGDNDNSKLSLSPPTRKSIVSVSEKGDSSLSSPKGIRGSISSISSVDGSIVKRASQKGSTGVAQWNISSEDSPGGRGQSKFFALLRSSITSIGKRGSDLSSAMSASDNRSEDLRPSSNRSILAAMSHESTVQKGSSLARENNTAMMYKSRMAAAQLFRGYSIGDYALVMTQTSVSSSRRPSLSIRNSELKKKLAAEKHLVNKFGYPKGKGKSQSERSGPFSYLLCTITKAHYEENEVYWTATREDNDAEIRGDAKNMYPITSQEALQAAQLAALMSRAIVEEDEELGDLVDSKREMTALTGFTTCFCIFCCFPFFCFKQCLDFVRELECFKRLLRHVKMFLDGREPYTLSFRITSVKVIVVCSIWYLFIDQIQLAFLPPSVDEWLAWVNFGVWLILVMELVVGVFVRPEGWNNLVRSDKAYTPQTRRHIANVHLIVESISLLFFVPVFYCIFSNETSCSERIRFSFLEAALAAVLGRSLSQAFYGRFLYGIVRLRVFALVRHWRNLWLNNTFLNYNKLKNRRERRRRAFLYGTDGRSTSTLGSSEDFDELEPPSGHIVPYGQSGYSNNSSVKKKVVIIEEQNGKEREEARVKASNIGTALMTINSYRALWLFCFLTACFPMLFLFNMQNVVNPADEGMVEYLQAINIQVPENSSSFDCDYLFDSVEAWSKAMVQFHPMPIVQTEEGNQRRQSQEASVQLVSLSIRPARCYENFNNTRIGNLKFNVGENCPLWSWSNEEDLGDCIYGTFRNITQGAESLVDIATSLSVRVGSMRTSQYPPNASNSKFSVSATLNHTDAVEYGARSSFILELLLFVIIIGMLIVLRKDTVELVFGSLRSMLRIILRYAKNPLSPPGRSERRHIEGISRNESGIYDSIEEGDEDDQLDRTYETEQLVTAVTKITDLLRKCWGVAGADIISTNLASTDGNFDVFNPTVPGRNVFALFAFAAITDFDYALKNLGGDVMILINDVAAVLHGEVYRWGLGDSGQCNRNLGSAFFMVFKIGSVMEVVEKLEQATQVVFSTATGKKTSKNKGLRTVLDAEKDVAMEAMAEAMQLSLEQIPGISTFADRAVIGMLKAYASIQRDTQLRAWSRDFRLNNYNVKKKPMWSVDMIFGMDAGWAIEGAVGSEYKIDATYLSPHVNMSSRMMSACKQYGVTILLSEAVHELLSEPAKNKMRNLDRVTVKGSSKVQYIYTYDARAIGGYLFLYNVSDEQADQQAKNYEPNIWNVDSDLKDMRHHLSEEFEEEFKAGMKAYYDGDWPNAIEKLELANNIMVETAMEEGDLRDVLDNETPEREELYRSETSDRPSLYLINFMKSKGGKAP